MPSETPERRGSTSRGVLHHEVGWMEHAVAAYDVRMDARQAALAEVSRHCDVLERLRLIPPSAKARGLYFRSIETTLSRAGRLDRYQALFPERFAAVLWHPVGELMTRLVVAGAILTEPSRVHEGMFEIGRRNAVVFAESLVGRTLLRILSRDPKRLLQQGAAGRRQSLNYGRWTLEFPEPRTAIMTMEEEYLYIESFLLGAAQGTFDAVGVPVRAEAKRTDRFNGRHILVW